MRSKMTDPIDKVKMSGLSTGYQKNMVEIITNDWAKSALRDLIEKIVGGGTPHREINEYFEGDIPWATVKDLSEDNYKADTIEHISRQGLKNSSANVVEKGNFIISTRMGLGRGFINVVDMAINQDLKGIFTKKDKLDVVFLMYWYKLNKDYIEKLGTGSTVKGIDLETLKNLQIKVPILDEQKRIVSVISTWDKAMELKEKLIEQKKLQKKCLMERLLTGKVRLPGFNGEWIEEKLADVFERITRRNLDTNTNVLTISAQKGIMSQGDFFTKSVASESLCDYYLLKKGEFAYNKSYSNGYPMGAIKRLNDYDKGVVTTLYICFKLKKADYSSDFFEQYFEAGMINRPLTKITHEGARAHGLLNISPNGFFDIMIKIPEPDEQLAISLILVSADKEISLLEKELEELKQQKKGLMQLLLTGKVRVPANMEV